MPSDWRGLVRFTNLVWVVWLLFALGGTRVLREPRPPDPAARLTAQPRTAPRAELAADWEVLIWLLSMNPLGSSSLRTATRTTALSASPRPQAPRRGKAGLQ